MTVRRSWWRLNATLSLLGFGTSGSTALTLRWLHEGWHHIYVVLIPLDAITLVIGLVLTLRMLMERS